MSSNLLPRSPYSLEQLEIATFETDRRVYADYLQYRLDSHFQPIFSLPHRRVVGHEALLRPYDRGGRLVPPLDLFSETRDTAAIVYLDRLCRDIHVRNFVTLGDKTNWLFLNVHAQVAMAAPRHAPFFRDLLTRYRVGPERIVVEIVENAISDEGRLAETVYFYKELGCLVAVDDFGAGHSNFNRLWRIAPHIVKFDRSLLVQARNKPAIRRLLPGLVALVHESGSLALLEGVETAEEAALAYDADFDFVQGFFFAHPASTIDQRAPAQLAPLWESIEQLAAQDQTRNSQQLEAHIEAFASAAKLLENGATLGEAGATLFQLPAGRSCFLLDAEGRQIGADAVPLKYQKAAAQFAPLADLSGAVWRHRDYFRRAIAHPGKVQLTRPYLSGDGAAMCMTLSIALTVGGATQVFCADVACLQDHSI